MDFIGKVGEDFRPRQGRSGPEEVGDVGGQGWEWKVSRWTKYYLQRITRCEPPVERVQLTKHLINVDLYSLLLSLLLSVSLSFCLSVFPILP